MRNLIRSRSKIYRVAKQAPLETVPLSHKTLRDQTPFAARLSPSAKNEPACRRSSFFKSCIFVSIDNPKHSWLFSSILSLFLLIRFLLLVPFFFLYNPLEDRNKSSGLMSIDDNLVLRGSIIMFLILSRFRKKKKKNMSRLILKFVYVYSVFFFVEIWSVPMMIFSKVFNVKSRLKFVDENLVLRDKRWNFSGYLPVDFSFKFIFYVFQFYFAGEYSSLLCFDLWVWLYYYFVSNPFEEESDLKVVDCILIDETPVSEGFISFFSKY